ncbi:MAG: hypothetical protein MZV70_68355 [Desulfobacterales bacterium]|nr:hypothetical protein [Desulfobacterales bacterium]
MTPHDHRHCLELFDKTLGIHRPGDGSEAERREIEAHIAECLACFACLQSLKQTIALCKQAGRQPVPGGVLRKLQTMIQDLAETAADPDGRLLEPHPVTRFEQDRARADLELTAGRDLADRRAPRRWLTIPPRA